MGRFNPNWSLQLGVCTLLLSLLAGCAVNRPAGPDASPATSPRGKADQTSRPVAGSSGSTPSRQRRPPTRVPEVRVFESDNYPTQLAQRRSQLASSGRDVLQREDVGYYLDVQQARLQQLGSDRLQLMREANQIRLRLSGPTSFEVGSARLTDDSAALIVRVADVLRDYRQSLFSVHGHTDDSGDAAANLRLSQQRALTVARLLVQHGVEPERVAAVGHGQSMPIDDNGTDAGRERNRRVELVLDPVLRAD